MILTLTPNTGIDYTLRVPRFELGETLRASAQVWGMGGKATDVSYILGKLSLPSRALGFAAGEMGRRMERMLAEQGVETDFLWVQGDTRLSIVLISEAGGQSTITSATLQVSAEQVTQLEERLSAALPAARCLVTGGSLPSGVETGFYERVLRRARQAGIPIIFDASGPALRAGLPGRPNLIKPNRAELKELLGAVPTTLKEVGQAAAKLQTEYGCDVIVTLGEEGALARLGERLYHIPALEVPVASTAGAGDGVLAGMALAYAHGMPLVDGLRRGFALAGAIVQTLATADYDVETYEALLSQVKIEEIS